jgi:CPA2 family monovalent cation:H+ antiporter-2
VRQARDSRYHLLRGYFHGADDPPEFDDEVHERLHSVPIEGDAWAVGRTIADLQLKSLGAEVTAVRRRGIRGSDPSADLILASGDVVVLRGTPDALELAEARLLEH